MRKVPVIVVIFVFAILSASNTLAQIPDPSLAAAAPTPASGHDYVGTGAETVNPADGLLTFDLPIQTPPGRQLSFPFGIRYSSSEQHFLTNAVSGGAALSWLVAPPSGYEVNGWGYKIPILTGTSRIQQHWTTPNFPLPPIDHQCDVSLNYVFRGIDGTQYTLPFGGQWPDVSYSTGTSCPSAPVESGVVNGLMVTSLPDPPLNSSQITVVDHSGTTYKFVDGSSNSISPNSWIGPSWSSLSGMQDRNGNTISITANGSGKSYTDTLGRTVISWTGIGNNGDSISVSGFSSNIILHWTSVPVTFPETAHSVSSTNGGCTAGHTASTTANVVSEIVLPNGQKYTFSYDAVYGRVSKIGFPAGGYVRYVWGLNPSSASAQFQGATPSFGIWTCDVVYDLPAVTDRYVSYDGTTEVLHQHFAYSTTWDTVKPQIWDKKNTNVTNTDLLTGQVTMTQYNYVPIAVPTGGPYDIQTGNDIPRTSPVEQSVYYKNGIGSIVKTVNKTWSSAYLMTSEQVFLDTNQGATTIHCYDFNSQLTDVYEYGFQSQGSAPALPACFSGSLVAGGVGPLLRHTQTIYHNFVGAHIVNQPDSITVFDGSGNQVKKATFAYDAGALQPSGAINLATPSGPRGNPTSVSEWINTGGSSTKAYNYYDTGQLYKITDPCGNTTCSGMTGTNHSATYSYVDHFAAGTGTPPGQTNAYLYQISYPNTGVAHTETFTFGYADGLVRSHTDQNNLSTTYQYGDPLLRVTQMAHAQDGAQTSYSYSDLAPSPTITTTEKITATLSRTSVVVTDGLGHVVQNKLTTDPQGTTSTETTYDGFGRIWKKSNLHRTAVLATDGITTNYYDFLGRICLVVPPGGTLPSTYSCPTTPPTNTVLTSYRGNQTLVTDQTGRQRRSFADSLGRLIEVDEPGNGQHDSGFFSPGTGSITVSGTEQSFTFNVVCGPNNQMCPQTVYDSGHITATVNGESLTTGWGQGSTSTSIAGSLATALTSGSFVNATSTGGTVFITAKPNGTFATNYPLSVTFSNDNHTQFPTSSFSATASGASLTGSTAGGAASGSGTLSLANAAVTVYKYNVLNNLMSVSQSARQRSFTYDSLSRLLTSTNPENGTVTYAYDANGNVATKTDARGIVATYSHDPLNRTLSESYSNGDPTITYAYDGTTPTNGCTASATSYGLAIGSRTAMCDASGMEAWTYNDVSGIGWQKVDKRTTAGVTKTTTVQYNLDASLSSLTYPTGRVVNYTSDAAGHSSNATDSSSGVTYASGTCGTAGTGVCYAPPGEVTSAKIGVSTSFTGLILTNTYNNRLQPVELKASSTGGNAFDITYNFVDSATSGNAEHVYGITNNLNNNRSQVFSYDPLNRLVSAGTSVKTGSLCWGYQFTYDIWANLTSQGADSTYTGCTETVMAPVTASTLNRISPFSYDLSGNATNDGTYVYVWDAQSQLKSAAGVNYTYDGDGRRVAKTGSKLYWYGPTGEIVAETNAAGTTLNEYVYFGGRRVAMLPAGSNPYYYVEDFLGSTKVITTNTGIVCYDADITPYGGERLVTNNCPQPNYYKFEGRERDAETGNDDFDARYYSSRFGRWLSADWSAVPAPVPYANFSNPQTLNLYAMVADDPETFADLTGHDNCGDYETCTSSSSHANSDLLDALNISLAQARSGVITYSSWLDSDEYSPWEYTISSGGDRLTFSSWDAAATWLTQFFVNKWGLNKLIEMALQDAAKKAGFALSDKAAAAIRLEMTDDEYKTLKDLKKEDADTKLQKLEILAAIAARVKDQNVKPELDALLKNKQAMRDAIKPPPKNK